VRCNVQHSGQRIRFLCGTQQPQKHLIQGLRMYEGRVHLQKSLVVNSCTKAWTCAQLYELVRQCAESITVAWQMATHTRLAQALPKHICGATRNLQWYSQALQLTFKPVQGP
jgi:hypothetical protein